MNPMGIFPLGSWAAQSPPTPRAAHPHSDAGSGRFRIDAGRRGRGLDSQLIVSRAAPSWRRASTLCFWRAPGACRGRGPAAPQATYPRPLGSKPWRLPGPGCPSPSAQAPRPEPPMQCHPGTRKPTLQWDAGQQVSRAQHPTSQPRLRLLSLKDLRAEAPDHHPHPS